MERIEFQDIFFDIERFKLVTKNIVHGFITGLHKSPFHGFSVEFSDHRPYNSGDSTEHIDWKLLAKTNKYFIKRYEDETNVNVYLILDHSSSMQFSSNKKLNSKLIHAKYIISALAYLGLKQRDAVGFYSINDTIKAYLPPKSKQNWLDQILNAMNNTKSAGTTNLSACLHEIAEKIKKRNLIIIVSDFMDDLDSLLSALNHFKYNSNDLILVNINDIQELELSYNNMLEMHDLETGETLLLNPVEIKKEYKQKVENHYHLLKENTLKLNYDYIDFKTQEDYKLILSAFLNRRVKLS